MLIGITSDSHDHVERIKQAVRILAERGIKTVIHAGDFVAPFALDPLVEAEVALYAIFGNNDGEIRGLKQKAAPIGGIQAAPYRFELAGKRFLLNHAPLSDQRIAAEQGRTDFVVFGHTHVAEYRRINGLFLINPGELCGWLKGKASFAILDTDTGDCEFVEL
ncbi:metallophosphoesterase [Candidatus Sumerlaeota bacterium]|nr:metallophosphoesterase [Candidatus Sumerlaeota bacterium]